MYDQNVPDLKALNVVRPRPMRNGQSNQKCPGWRRGDPASYDDCLQIVKGPFQGRGT